jgi:hypothetical protein
MLGPVDRPHDHLQSIKFPALIGLSTLYATYLTWYIQRLLSLLVMSITRHWSDSAARDVRDLDSIAYPAAITVL